MKYTKKFTAKSVKNKERKHQVERVCNKKTAPRGFHHVRTNVNETRHITTLISTALCSQFDKIKMVVRKTVARRIPHMEFIES